MTKIYNLIIRFINIVAAKVNKYLTSAYELFNTNNISMLPANIAFFTMWGIVPIIIIWDSIQKVFPNIASIDAIDDKVVSELTNFINVDFTFGDGGYIVLFFILYLSSKPFTSIINASNYIYGFTDRTNFIKVKLKSVILSVLLLLTVLLLLVIPVLGEKIIYIIENVFGSVPLGESLTSAKWILTLVYLFVVLFVIYAFSPEKKLNYKLFLPGTIFSTFGWMLVTYLYSIYVNEFANYDKIYSSFTSVIILMIWLYFISYILIIGLVINAAYFKEKTHAKNL